MLQALKTRKERKKTSKKDPTLAIPKPKTEKARNGVLKTNLKVNNRCLGKLREIALGKARVRAQNFVKFAQVIRVPFKLETLNKNFSAIEKEELEEICEKKLGPGQESQCASAQFVDMDGHPILFYFGDRIIIPNQKPPVKYQI